MGESNTLLYLLYGNSREYHLELSYSVLSAVHAGAEALRIVLVTDEKTRRDDLPLEHLVFTDEEFRGWTLDGRYNHAVKIGCLLKAMDHFGGKVALIDTDTYLTGKPAELFDRINPGSAVMHVMEGDLDGQLGYYDVIIDHARSKQVEGFVIDGSSPMFNSGVVGVHQAHREAIENALALVHTLHAVAPDVHTLEQFAVGTALAKHGEVRTSEDLVRHYYGYGKHFIHCELAKMFTDMSAPEFDRALANFTVVTDFPGKKPLDLLRSKLKARRRGLGSIYAFAYLAYLSAFSTRRNDHANAWASVAIDAIRWNKFPPNVVEADFGRLGPSRLAENEWLKPATRDLWNRYWSMSGA